jgi:hypothetical protein
MGSCEIRFGQKQDYHVLNPLPSLYPNQLAETSLPYITKWLNDLKVKNRLKVKVAFQSISDPIQAEPKKAFVDAVGAINQPGFLLGNDP